MTTKQDFRKTDMPQEFAKARFRDAMLRHTIHHERIRIQIERVEASGGNAVSLRFLKRQLRS